MKFWRDVMPLDAISPGARLRWVAEDGEEIAFRIALRSFAVLHQLQNLVQAHDGGRLDVAALAETGGKQGVGELLLFGSHVAERKTLARFRDEMPVEPLVILKLESRLRALVGVQRCQESLGRVRHDGGGVDASVGGSEEDDPDPDREQP